MEDNLYLCNLYEYYKELLTDKQKDCFEDYYFENLTMEEIAENNEVSKNAISKTLKETRDKLIEFESKLQLNQKRNSIISVLNKEEVEKIINYI